MRGKVPLAALLVGILSVLALQAWAVECRFAGAIPTQGCGGSFGEYKLTWTTETSACQGATVTVQTQCCDEETWTTIATNASSPFYWNSPSDCGEPKRRFQIILNCNSLHPEEPCSSCTGVCAVIFQACINCEQ